MNFKADLLIYLNLCIFSVNGLLTPNNPQNQVSFLDESNNFKIRSENSERINEVEKQESSSPSQAASIQCGDVLTGMSGIIAYKVGIPFDNNERCTWTVYAPHAESIRFEIEENGIIERDADNIKIGFFRDADYKNIQDYQEYILSHNSENRSMTVPGPVAYVRFFSNGAITGLGFRISYHGKKTSIKFPFKFSNYFYSAPYGRIRYPPGNVLYSHLERASFVIKITTPGYLALKYYDGDCGVDKDFLTIFLLGESLSPVSDVYQFCNSSVAEVPLWNIAQDLLITFHTSMSSQNRGFDLLWVPA